MQAKTYALLLGILITGIVIWNIGSLIAGRLKKTPQPNIAQAGETDLSHDRLFFPGLVDNDAAVIGLVTKGTEFVKIDRASGTMTKLLAKPIDFAPTEVSYAPDGHAAIAHRNTDAIGGPARTVLYDFAAKTSWDLNAGIQSAAWVNATSIVYLFSDNGKTYKLATAAPDATNFRVLLDSVTIKNPRLSLAPNSQTVLLWRTYSGETADIDLAGFELEQVSLADGQVEAFTQHGMTAPLWSPDGKTIAYVRIRTNDHLGELATLPAAGGDEHLTGIISIPGKFAWRNPTSLVVASPDPADSQDLVTDISLATSDKLWLVPTSSAPTPITTISGTPPIDNLMVANGGKTLLFRRLATLIQAPLP